jgi:hypothetical protein
LLELVFFSSFSRFFFFLEFFSFLLHIGPSLFFLFARQSNEKTGSQTDDEDFGTKRRRRRRGKRRRLMCFIIEAGVNKRAEEFNVQIQKKNSPLRVFLFKESTRKKILSNYSNDRHIL